MALHFNPVIRGAVYEFKPKENDSYVWEVTELNLHNFKKTFDFEPNFELGDQKKITIRKIFETGTGWTLTLEEWPHGRSFGPNGSIEYAMVPRIPAEYDGQIFIPAPARDFLLEAYKTLPTEYILSGLTVTYRARGYTRIKEYTPNGVLVSESILDASGIVCVKMEGTFRMIPSGIIEPIAIILVATAFLIFKMSRKKQISTA